MKSSDLLHRLQSRVALRRNWINNYSPSVAPYGVYVRAKQDQQLDVDLYRKIVNMRRGNAY